MAGTERKTPFARFFSSVQGHVVSRYGSGTPLGLQNVDFRNNAPIGATLTQDGYVWDKDAVTAITDAEARFYKLEYDGHVARGELREVTEDDYLAFVLAHEALEAKAEAPAKKELAAEDEG